MAESQVILNLDEYDAAAFTKYLHDRYKEDLGIHVETRFEGDSVFRVNIIGPWIYIEIENDHTDMVRLLESYPAEHKLINMLPETIKYNFYKDESVYKLEDFRVIPEMWKLHRLIKRIEIVSHNIIFKRFAPPPLKILCLQLIDVDILKDLPEHVLNKLDGFKEQKTPKVEEKKTRKEYSSHFKVRFTLKTSEPTRYADAANNTPVDQDATNDIPTEQAVINDIPVEQATGGPSTGHRTPEELEERSKRLRLAINEDDDLDELDLFGRLTTMKLRNLPPFERERIICHIDSLFNVRSSMRFPAPPPMLPDAEPWILTHQIFAPQQDFPQPPPNFNMDGFTWGYNLHFE